MTIHIRLITLIIIYIYIELFKSKKCIQYGPCIHLQYIVINQLSCELIVQIVRKWEASYTNLVLVVLWLSMNALASFVVPPNMALSK